MNRIRESCSREIRISLMEVNHLLAVLCFSCGDGQTVSREVCLQWSLFGHKMCSFFLEARRDGVGVGSMEWFCACSRSG